MEKKVCLSVGLHVANLLRKKGISVLLTRAQDATVPLDRRTSLANRIAADVFVSIHANSSVSKSAQGIETFCLKSIQSNSESTTLGKYDAAIIQQLLTYQSVESETLAHKVHSQLIATIEKEHIPVINRNVKKATSQVLVGTHMPSILIELGFLTHKVEGTYLASAEYQKILAQGITDGIFSYIKMKKAL